MSTSDSNLGGAPGETLTMVDVERVIGHHRDALVQHPFLQRLEAPGSIQEFRRMAPRLAFFVLVFQDVLRLARDLSTDKLLRKILGEHAIEDSGHDRWYLDDLDRLGVRVDLRWLFSEEHVVARDVGYRLASSVMDVKDDRSRLAIVLSLEAIGREFFVRVPPLAHRLGIADGLTYFAVGHLGIERDHAVFSSEGSGALASIEVSQELVPEVLSVVEGTFQVMGLLANDIERAMRDC